MRLVIRPVLCIVLFAFMAGTGFSADWCYESVKREKYAEAVGACTKELDAGTGDRYALLVNRGIAYTGIEQYDAAVDDLTAAVDRESRDAKVYIHRGYALALLGRYPEAEKDLQTALDLEPDSTPAMVNMVELYALQNKIDLACVWLKKVMLKGEKYWGLLRSGKAISNMKNSPCFPESQPGR